MSIAIRLRMEPLRGLGFEPIEPVFMAVGTALDHPARIILVQNTTDQLLTFSFDGVNDQFVLPSDSFILLDITGNKTITAGFFIEEGTQLYVRYAIAQPTLGSVFFSVFYGETGIGD